MRHMIKSVGWLLLFPWCAFPASPAKIVLIAGTPSHDPGEHEYTAGTLLLEKCLNQNRGVKTVVVRGGWPGDAAVLDDASAIVLYMDGGPWHPILKDARIDTLNRLVRKGVGLACLHFAIELPQKQGGLQLLSWIGGYYEVPYSQNPITDVSLTRASPMHTVSRGWKTFQCNDEWYYKIRFQQPNSSVPLLTALLPKGSSNRETVAWLVERPDGGRGFGFTGGHFHKNWGLADQRRLVVNAILWTAKVPIPKTGAKCDITAADLAKNLDRKPGVQGQE